MKIRLVLVPLLVCTLLGVLAVHAQEGKKDDTTELGEHMEKINGAFRALRKQISDPAKNEDSIKRLETIHQHAEAALQLQPELTKEKPADEQAKFVANYQEHMKGFIADVEKTEAAVKAGNNEEAAKLLRTLGDDQKEGHSHFRKKKKRS